MPDSAAQTISFAIESSDGRSRFESFLSFHPEAMCHIGTTFVMASEGDIYTQDGDGYNNFFDEDYESTITPVFNQFPANSKSYTAIDERASKIWTCPLIETSLISNGLVPQASNLVEQDFEYDEGKWQASFSQDVNSLGGLIEGDDLKGFYVFIKFQVSDASDLVSLNQLLLHYIDSPLNKP